MSTCNTKSRIATYAYYDEELDNYTIKLWLCHCRKCGGPVCHDHQKPHWPAANYLAATVKCQDCGYIFGLSVEIEE
jgi:hypothetical protein